MIYLSDETIDNIIREDLPYGDLTTWTLGIRQERGFMQYFSRQEAVLCGTEEASRILAKMGVQVTSSLPSGQLIQPGEVFLEAAGAADALHMAWKVTQNLLECCSGIATKTKRVVDIVKAANPAVSVVSTRKSFPGTKQLSVKAVCCGGAFPHRLGLSESLLVFSQHMNFLGGLDGFIPHIPELKAKVPEKKLLVETDSLESALRLCQAGVDALQFDKLSPEKLRTAVAELKAVNPALIVLAAGGIDERNAGEYAGSGVNALVTSSLFFAGTMDMSVNIGPV
ncbi:ModD protein [Paenibacillus sp. S150]|uniref:ModD protein n=1 Tax=Paenibacillus sp. S150 TaxID=2749826 RepID=UPI001C585DB2|nr:ModD protein [Paenibacillus sp. S150]MBW4080904.1 ModD protein [Paenibacillus sp. S150]